MTREIREFLSAAEDYWTVHQPLVWFTDGAGPPIEDLAERRLQALAECLPPRLRDMPVSNFLRGSVTANGEIGGPLVDEFVWFPLLVEEFDGDREAAEAAWALGQRPSARQGGAG